jgi:hypothetical protein
MQTTDIKGWEGFRVIGTVIHGLWENDTAIWKDNLAVSYETKHILLIDPTNTLFGIYSKELKT